MNEGRSLSWQAAFALPLAAGFIGTLLSVSLSSGMRAMASNDAGPAIATTTPVAVAHSSTSATAANQPARLIIPAIGVRATVQSVGLSKTGNGTIGIPSNFTDAAWYNGSPIPGDPGTAIIDGHLDGRYVQKGVFYDLGKLTLGDSIYVEDRAGVRQRFIVTGRQQLASNADTSMLFANTSVRQLALITCAGDWLADKHQYSDRIVVFATLAN